MYYVYVIENNVNISKVEPQCEYFTIDKMPPLPNKKYQKLYADFENKKVWYDTRDLTEEEIKQERIEEIKSELNSLDTTINRATEDLYILTDLRAYDTIEEVITRKEELRKELKNLTR